MKTRRNCSTKSIGSASCGRQRGKKTPQGHRAKGACDWAHVKGRLVDQAGFALPPLGTSDAVHALAISLQARFSHSLPGVDPFRKLNTVVLITGSYFRAALADCGKVILSTADGPGLPYLKFWRNMRRISMS
jgi:hypothetical protein